MEDRGQRALHPRLVARVDPRHRRPTVRMSAAEIERAVAEAGLRTPARSRLARGSGELSLFDPEPDPYPDPAFRLLPFRARRPVLATLITAVFAAALLLALHHIIAGA
ncbi:MAG TPA: hypothetical protein VFU21_32865 [Kofleriaceae bacterium]|nr:hypothetical protein [Kofleriaceae bacterium]